MNAENLDIILEEEELRMINLACDSEHCYVVTNEYELMDYSNEVESE